MKMWPILIVLSLSSTEFCCLLLETPAHVSLWLSLCSRMMRFWSPAATAPTNTLLLNQAPTSSSASMTRTAEAEFLPISSFTHTKLFLINVLSTWVLLSKWSICRFGSHSVCSFLIVVWIFLDYQWANEYDFKNKRRKPQICKLIHFIVHIQTLHNSFMNSGHWVVDRFNRSLNGT